MALRAPDPEGALIGWLGLRGWTVRDVLKPPWPAVALNRIGGERATVADFALIQVDYASDAAASKSGALAGLEAVIADCREAEGETTGGAVIASVEVSAAPAYVPDPVTGAPRYTATLAVTSRALVPQGP